MKNQYNLKFSIFGFVIKTTIRKKSFDEKLKNTFRLINEAVTESALEIAEKDFNSYTIFERSSCTELERAAVLLHRKKVLGK